MCMYLYIYIYVYIHILICVYIYIYIIVIIIMIYVEGVCIMIWWLRYMVIIETCHIAYYTCNTNFTSRPSRTSPTPPWRRRGVCYVISYQTMLTLLSILLYNIISYCIILYYSILYYTICYYDILYSII